MLIRVSSCLSINLCIISGLRLDVNGADVPPLGRNHGNEEDCNNFHAWHSKIKDGLVIYLIIWRGSFTLDETVDGFNKDERVDQRNEAKLRHDTANFLAKLADVGVDKTEGVHGNTSCSVDKQTGVLEGVGKVNILLSLCASYTRRGDDKHNRGNTWEEFDQPSNSTGHEGSAALVSILEEPNAGERKLEKQEEAKTEGCNLNGGDSLERVGVAGGRCCLYPDDSRNKCNNSSDTKDDGVDVW